MLKTNTFLYALPLFLVSSAAVAQNEGNASSVPNEVAATDPVPIGNPGFWAAARDYPISALREYREGTVRFRLDITADGNVSDCWITVSSGSSDLDEKACELLIARGTFKPARLSSGEFVRGTWTSAVRWEIPTPALGGPKPNARKFVMFVETDGSVSNCTLVSSDMSLPSEIDGCGNYRNKRYRPYLDAKGRPVRKCVTMTMETTVEDASD